MHGLLQRVLSSSIVAGSMQQCKDRVDTRAAPGC